MKDETEGIRRVMVGVINSEEFVIPEGKTWSTDELTQDFEVLGFAAPFVIARHKATGKKGSLMFKHSPRVYFDWKEN